jgi:hypothetical protein
MEVLGFRFSNTDYAYCRMSGTREAPSVQTAKAIAFPAGFEEAEILRWLHQDLQSLFEGNEIQAVGIKKPEATVRRSNALEFRVQCEAIASLVSAESGCSAVERRVKATIAKHLGLKGRGKYLQTTLDTSPIPDFGRYPPKVQEAILVAWSCED